MSSSSSKFYHLAAALASQRPPRGVTIKTLQTPVAHSLSLFLRSHRLSPTRCCALTHSLALQPLLARSLAPVSSAERAQANTITNLPPHTHTHAHDETHFVCRFRPVLCVHQLSQVSNAFHRLWTALVLLPVPVPVQQSTGQRMCASRFKSKLSRTRHGRTGSGSGFDTRHSAPV